MSEPALAERHEAGVEIPPHEEQEERNRRVVLVRDGVNHGQREIEPEQNFGIGHPASLVFVFLLDESILLPSMRNFGVRANSDFLPISASITACALRTEIPMPVAMTKGM